MEELRLEPEAGILIESLRDIGYSFNSAVADIVDNSITAKAREIRILAIPSDDFKIAIIDDGDGLSRDDLLQAMRLGSTDPRQDRALNDLGRFGLGLKTASFSQCRKLTVASLHRGMLSAFTWDLDRVVETNEWTVIEQTDLASIPYIDELGESGTLVLWENIDRLASNKSNGKVDYDRTIRELQDYLSLVFHRFIEGEKGIKPVTFRVNNAILDAFDPFNLRHAATQRAPKETIRAGVTMESFTLPHRSLYQSQQEYEKYGLPGGYLKNQGVYLYRAKRLIVYGTWFGIAKKTSLTQLARVKIDIDLNQDEIWKIDVKKVHAQPPEDVRDRLKSLIATIGAPSRKTYRRRATRLTSQEHYPTWNVEQAGSKKLYKINRLHPVIESFRKSLDENELHDLDSVLSLIEATFPTESVFYDLSNNEDGIAFASIEGDEFKNVVKTFFATLKQSGQDESIILNIMRSAPPFDSRWNETLEALGIEER